jgi:exodeoxyribonuclease-3
MKIVSWNCQGGLRKKLVPILSYNPDILIIQECEGLDKLKFPKEMAPHFSWRSGNHTVKGLAIFCFGAMRTQPLGVDSPDFQHLVPFRIITEEEELTLFAVWAMGNKECKMERYIGQVWKGINFYDGLIQQRNVILMGDFNSNKIWDYKPRIGNHSAVVNRLKEGGIVSLYHTQEKVNHGSEKHPTFFLQRKLSKPYHIDYCFASKNLTWYIQIGVPAKWLSLSDHMPLIVDIKG